LSFVISCERQWRAVDGNSCNRASPPCVVRRVRDAKRPANIGPRLRGEERGWGWLWRIAGLLWHKGETFHGIRSGGRVNQVAGDDSNGLIITGRISQTDDAIFRRAASSGRVVHIGAAISVGCHK